MADDVTTDHPLHDVRRRTVLRAAGLAAVAAGGAGVLAACSDDAGSTQNGNAGTGDPGSGDSGTGDAAPVTVATADVPEGGGVVVDQKYVVTQPAAGEFRAFTAICTHQGCVVEKVEQRQIVCPCHGSHFSISDGSPTTGPAQTPLAKVDVSVSGGKLTVRA